MTEAQIRSVQITEVDTEEGTFQGVFAPYGEVIEYNGKKERYERGLFEGADLVDLYYNHGKESRGGDMPIGEVVEYIDSDEGLGLTGRFFLDTPRGAEAYALTKGGHLNSLSAGFLPTQTREEEDGVTVWERALLNEVSLVKRPAYPSAQISQVRSESNTANEIEKEVSLEDTKNMSEEVNTYDDSEIRSKIEVVERELAVVRENGVSTNSESESLFRSAGEWGVAVLNGDARAQEERALVVSTDGHFSNDWRGGLVTVVERGRPLVGLFEKNTIANGHKTFEFLKALNGSGAVAVQSSEGATIANLSGSVTTDTGTIQTYAGYIDVSFQSDDLTDVDLTGALIRYAAESYGKITNDRLRTVLAAASAQTGSAFTLSSATAQDFIKAVTDARIKIDANGTLARTTDFALVSTDVFLAMATTVDGSGRPSFAVAGNNAVNAIGNVNPLDLTINVAGLPVVLDTGLANKSLYVASKNAVGSWENVGAPLDLRAVKIDVLTKQYALYGYFESKVKDANGLVKANIS